jgi:outer membrane biosynthesis protein TonB
MGRERTNFAPALLAAVGLHAAVLLAGLIAWPWINKPTPIGAATAVTLVAEPPALLRPAVQAPEPAPAAAPEPEPAPPTPPPPAPEPTPRPPAPKPAPAPPTPPKPQPPTPKPTPAPPKPPTPAPAPTPKPTPPAPAKPAPKTPPAKPAEKQGFDLAGLTASLDKTAKSDARHAGGVKGPLRAEAAPVARLDPGAAEAATNDAAAEVGSRLNRIWNKSCGVEGFRDIVIQVKFNLTPAGDLEGAPRVVNGPAAPSPVWTAASDRALRAVSQAAPFRELPKQTYAQWRSFTAVFDAKEACKNQ